ncbi:MAG TPA: M15 family metallopeptidase [Acidimicrobiales bacterium]|nr:M15 family metallopeptidase [Acidimicrobiales bacterium]
MRRRLLGTLAVLAVLAAGCGGDGRPAPSPVAATATTTTSAAPATTTTAAPTTTTAAATTTTTRRTTTTVARPAATTTTAAAPAVEGFGGSVGPVDPARLTASWHPGCPVGPDGLRLVTVTHWGYDGQRHQGELVVAARYADAVLGVFRSLYQARFPVKQVHLVDEYGGDDDASMAADNTSAFNCRTVAGSTNWSEHAYGRAVDLNPLVNPYVTSSGVSPPAGAPYASRDTSVPGLITRDGPAVRAFAAIGWGWGGSWSSGKDYQHFSASGR